MTYPPYGSPAPEQPPGSQYPQAGPYAVPAPPAAPTYAPAQAAAPYAYPPAAPQGYAPHGPSAYAQSQFGAPADPYAAQWGAPQQQPGLVCRFCGGFPAVEATVRGHQGMLILMRFLSLKGPFCRGCGIAVHREMTTRTMWQGWWGYLSFLITPFTLLYNFVPRSKFNKLPAPQGGFRPPSDPGKPIFLRPGALGLLAPGFILFVLLLAALVNN